MLEIQRRKLLFTMTRIRQYLIEDIVSELGLMNGQDLEVVRNVILDKNSLSQWIEEHLLCVPSETPCRNEALISLTDGIVVCRWFTSLSIFPGNAHNQRELFIQVYTNCRGSHNPMIGQCCPLNLGHLIQASVPSNSLDSVELPPSSNTSV